MASVVVTILQLVTVVLVVRAVLSWIPISPGSSLRPLVDGVYRVTEPVLAPVRRLLPPMGGLDLSVLLVILVIQVVLIPVAVKVF